MSRYYRCGNRVIEPVSLETDPIEARIVADSDPLVVGVLLKLTATELGSCYSPTTWSPLDPPLSSSLRRR